jgi:hypothetical protein
MLLGYCNNNNKKQQHIMQHSIYDFENDVYWHWLNIFIVKCEYALSGMGLVHMLQQRQKIKYFSS